MELMYKGAPHLHADAFVLHAFYQNGSKGVVWVFLSSIQEVGYEHYALHNIGFAQVWSITHGPVQPVHCNCQSIHKITGACSLQA